MTFTATTITVKNATGDPQTMGAYTDGTIKVFAHAILDSTGALISPATSGKQDTANTALGAPADAAVTNPASSGSIIAFLKGILTSVLNIPAKGSANAANSLPVVIASDQAALALPTGAATSANQATGNASLATIATNTTGAATASKQDTGNASLSSIDGKLPALDNSKVSVIPAMTAGGNTSAQTATMGTTYTAFSSQACKQLTVSNQTGTALEFQQGGSGVGFQIPTGIIYTFFGITNANQIGVRRVDTLNTQVTLTARWES